MKCIIETKDKTVLEQLKPLIEVAQSYKGHFNASYTSKNSDYIVMDNIHKKACLKQLLDANNGFIIGTGGGHIWVAIHSASRLEYKKDFNKKSIEVVSPGDALAINGIQDRVLLIIDEN